MQRNQMRRNQIRPNRRRSPNLGRSVALIIGVASAALTAGCASAQESLVGVRVAMHTEAGVFELVLDTVRAPITATNFLRYVDAGGYSDGYFHRTVRDDNQPTDSVKIDVVQGSRARGFEGFGRIPLERTSLTGLRHEDGAISMARGGPDTASSDFFICVGPQPELDFGGARNPDGQGFAVFGEVVSGMEVVRRIHEADAEGQRLTPPIAILFMERITR
ncbi:MAG: peptidylprolyl isomerase [Gemmatimonadetes bacterium]|nr:peptidylprolyl isomerase [Gemmatimonadota bacterium]